MKIGIISGSIREGRQSQRVAEWILAQAPQQDDVTLELIDLKEFNVPLLTAETLPAMANGQYDDPAVQRWGDAIAACDGYVFVTPEYNHGVPGAFKNAFDSLGVEWMGKPVAFVSYGADQGIRSVEQWRQIIANFSMIDIRGSIALSLFTEFGAEGFTPNERRAGELSALLEDLATTIRTVRS